MKEGDRDMLIGKRISGRYKVLEMIGGGGMANVYLAHDMILDRDVAVKVLRLDFSDDEEFIRRFHREAQSATSLAHPNIVNIYDVGEENSIYYIVMEYVDGQTLKQYIQQRSPVPVEVALEILQQLASAIAHAHQNHIIHRDIKPQNILIDHNGNVKITDFGIAMALSATSITQTNSVLGSVHYLSPEQARGGMANKKSDIYSLGIVMFELLTGRLPFSGESAISIALKHLQSETPSLRRWNPQIPQSVENIVLKATAKDPFLRYDSVEEMEQDLSTALEPSRMNEEKFTIPLDVEATKVLPIITDEHTQQFSHETVVRDKEQPSAKTKDSSNVKKSSKKWPIILISTFVTLVLLGIFVVLVLPKLLAPSIIKVPDVTGYELDQAIEELQAAGFTIGETFEVTDEEIEAELIVRTDPKADKEVKEGTAIDLFQSTGKEKYELENYIGKTYDSVERLLTNNGFKVTKKEVHDDKAPAGEIIDQSFNEGDKLVPEDTELEFTVSIGPELITLKDLSGFNQKGLQEYALSVGLNIDIASEGQHHETIEKGEVISQDPKVGTELRKGDHVVVVLSLGKKEIPLQTVTREITIHYEPIEEGVPQFIQIFIEDNNRSMTDPYQSFEITSDVTRILDFTIAYGKKAGFKVMRDNTVIIDELVPYPETEQ